MLKRLCTRCQIPKGAWDFYPGRSSWCADCHKSAAKQRRSDSRVDLAKAEKDRRSRLTLEGRCHRHPDRFSQTRGRCSECVEDQRRSRVKKDFGITLAEYDSYMTVGCCQVCGRTRLEVKLALDHCHRTGIIRGVLCRPCNQALGLLYEDPTRIKKLVAYIEGFSNE